MGDDILVVPLLTGVVSPPMTNINNETSETKLAPQEANTSLSLLQFGVKIDPSQLSSSVHTNYFITSQDVVHELSHGCYCHQLLPPSPPPSLGAAALPTTDNTITLKPYILCRKCFRLFHQECISIPIQPLPFPGDYCYNFKCKNCGGGQEFFSPVPRLWTHILYIAMFNLNLIANIQAGLTTFTKVWLTSKQIIEFIEKCWPAIGNPNLNLNKNHISVVLSNSIGVMVERSKAQRAWALLTPQHFPTFDKKGCKRRASNDVDVDDIATDESSSQKKKQKRRRTGGGGSGAATRDNDRTLSGDSSTKGEGNGFSGSSDSTASEQLAYAQTLIQQQQQIIKSQEDVIQSLTANTKELEKQIKNANELIAQYKEQEKKLVEDLQQRDNVLQEIVSLLQTQNVSIPDDVRSLLEANTAKNEG